MSNQAKPELVLGLATCLLNSNPVTKPEKIIGLLKVQDEVSGSEVNHSPSCSINIHTADFAQNVFIQT